MSSPGLTYKKRRLIDSLNRAYTRPFTVHEAAKTLGTDPSNTSLTLAYLAKRGWLSRVRRGLYTTVPLGASQPSDWRANSFVVASQVFPKSYIGGWSALEQWHLTDQLFRDVMVITQQPVRARKQNIQKNGFYLKKLSPSKHFGFTPIWIDGNSVAFSNPTKTIVDILDEPRIGGGIRHVIEAVLEYFESTHRDDALLSQYIKKFENRTIYKRLGMILDTAGIDAAPLIREAEKNLSAGFSLLDPSLSDKGPTSNKWRLRVNARMDLLDD